jgi:hypothetical protein
VFAFANFQRIRRTIVISLIKSSLFRFKTVLEYSLTYSTRILVFFLEMSLKIASKLSRFGEFSAYVMKASLPVSLRPRKP